MYQSKGVSVSASEDMCNDFNDFFASVFTEGKPGAVPECERIFKGRVKEESCGIVITQIRTAKKLEGFDRR